MTHITPVLAQAAFRGRENSGNEATPTWIAAADTNWTQAIGESFRLRFVIQETAGEAESLTPELRYQINGAGGYAAVTGTNSDLRYTGLSGASDGDATTQQLGAGSFVAGEVDSNNTIAAISINNQETEIEFCLVFLVGGLADGDYVDFRVYNGNSALDSYASEPRVTANDLFAAEVQHFRFYDSDGGEAASTALAAEDTNYTADLLAGDVALQFRVMIEEVGGGGIDSLAGLQLRASLNGGSYQNVTDPPTLAGVGATTAGLPGTEGATTNRGTDGLTDGAGSFQAGVTDTTGDINTAQPLGAGNFTEYVFGINLVSADLSDGDFVRFIFASSANLTNLTPAPQINISKGAGTVAIGIATSANTAAGIVPLKTRALGQALEADAAQPAVAERIVSVSLAAEADTAQAADAAKLGAIGLSSEADSAFAAQPLRVIALGQALEADSAFSLAFLKGKVIGLVAEADQAFAALAAKRASIGLAAEVAGAFSIGVVRAMTLGQPSEADSAFAVTAERAVGIGLAVGADLAFGAARSKSVALGQAVEADIAFAVAAGVNTVVSLGQALEVDAALEFSAAKRQAIGLAGEADSAFAVAPSASRVVVLGQASEADLAFPVLAARRRTIGQALETDLAQSLSISRAVTLGAASSSDSALPLASAKALALGLAAESDSAFAITASIGGIELFDAERFTLAIPGVARRTIEGAVQRVALEIPGPERITVEAA